LCLSHGFFVVSHVVIAFSEIYSERDFIDGKYIIYRT
jgi:hypothetical protein